MLLYIHVFNLKNDFSQPYTHAYDVLSILIVYLLISYYFMRNSTTIS